MNFTFLGSLNFEVPRRQDFPALDLAAEAGTLGGTRPAVLNAANEVAVEAFLGGRIAFPGIWKLVAEVLEKCPHTKHPSLEALLATDTEARRLARASISFRANAENKIAHLKRKIGRNLNSAGENSALG